MRHVGCGYEEAIACAKQKRIEAANKMWWGEANPPREANDRHPLPHHDDVQRSRRSDDEDHTPRCSRRLPAGTRERATIEPRKQHLRRRRTAAGHFNELRGYVQPARDQGVAGVKVVGDSTATYVERGLPSGSWRS
jgi:hypothetical protein